MKLFILTTILSLLSFTTWSMDYQSFTSKADKFFITYVKEGLVDYKRVGTSKQEIEALYAAIGEMKLDGLNDFQKQAFYINAHNLIVIYWVTKHYPLKSPLDDSGFFDKVRHQVAGEALTLNMLEIKKLLATYQDARFHFALACAAKSCPPLASFAFKAETLDKQLNERTAAALNNSKWLIFNEKTNQVSLSKIFDWYKKDFNAGSKTTIKWINQYRKNKISEKASITFYEYDWSLNER
ncbi:MAG: DUF547 domain-containing protein [Cyclobacteriaceae bacterium]|nr:DUF547 domain-containing protein [Cyclobacteriaceae bacterium]